MRVCSLVPLPLLPGPRVISASVRCLCVLAPRTRVPKTAALAARARIAYGRGRSHNLCRRKQTDGQGQNVKNSRMYIHFREASVPTS